MDLDTLQRLAECADSSIRFTGTAKDELLAWLDTTLFSSVLFPNQADDHGWDGGEDERGRRKRAVAVRIDKKHDGIWDWYYEFIGDEQPGQAT